jgi:hypothetical protein
VNYGTYKNVQICDTTFTIIFLHNLKNHSQVPTFLHYYEITVPTLNLEHKVMFKKLVIKREVACNYMCIFI